MRRRCGPASSRSRGRLDSARGHQPPLAVDVSFSREGDGIAPRCEHGARKRESVCSKTKAPPRLLAEAVAVTLALLLDRAPRHTSPLPRSPPRRRPDCRGPFFDGMDRLQRRPRVRRNTGRLARIRSALGLDREHWSIELGGTATLARSVRFASGTVRVGLTSGNLQLCRMIDLAGPTLRAGACARAAAGQYRGDGDGYPTTASVRIPWMAAGGGLRVGGLWGPHLRRGVSGLLLIPVRKQTLGGKCRSRLRVRRRRRNARRRAGCPVVLRVDSLRRL